MKGFEKTENILVIFLAILTTILSFSIIIEGINNLITRNYLSLGDPFHKSDILAFERAPFISRLALVILILVLVNLVLLSLNKRYEKRFLAKK